MRALTRRVNDQRGVSAIIVAISLLAIFAMITLVVDLGLQLINRRIIVRAADSAVLAAAQSYALEENGAAAGTNDAPAIAQADALATANIAEAIRESYAAFPMGGCPLPDLVGLAVGCVTAKYHADQDSIFAPTIGGNATGRVGWEASAAWGVARSGNPVPFELDAPALSPCLIEVPEGEPETECAFWFNNESTPASTWDFMNLNEWDVAPDSTCSNVGTSELNDWISGRVLVETELDTIPTYVCRATGARPPVWNELAEQVGKIKFFPVNDPDREVLGEHRKYAIIGWAPMRVVAVLSGEAAYGSGMIACEDTTWDPTPGAILYLDLLAGRGGNPCPNGQNPDFATAPVISKGGTTYVEGPGADYTYDPSTRTVTWLRDDPPDGPPQDVKVEFDWALSGRCGVQEPDPNSRCIVLSYPGPQTGGTGICTAGCEDFGLRAVVLVK
jgi:hypothetical protein